MLAIAGAAQASKWGEIQDEQDELQPILFAILAPPEALQANNQRRVSLMLGNHARLLMRES